MAEFKVRDLGEVDSKSVQEVEKELLEKHEQQFEEQKAETPAVEENKEETPTEEFKIKDEDVLSHIKDRYGKEINSLDELISERESSPELPEDVEAFFNYKKETGRGIDDFIKLNKDFDEMDSDTLLADYYKHTEDGLDSDDINDLIDSKFGYDEDLDEESLIKKQKLAKKRELNKAKKFFKEQQESYKVPLESRKESDDLSSNEEYKAYRDKMKEAESVEAENQKKREWFSKKTDELFSDEFKGFEFSVNDEKFTFKPADAAELKESHQTPLNFIHKYIGKDGLLEDAVGYHKALSAAMNPDKFAKFFYEQGQAAAVDGMAKKSKNIDMNTRRAPEVTKKGGMQVRSLNQDSGRGLKIRSKRT
tara:strand:+ start:5887 stop:6978 length:1092 start_codon:yes stop_codon:yes gene_type:complete